MVNFLGGNWLFLKVALDLLFLKLREAAYVHCLTNSNKLVFGSNIICLCTRDPLQKKTQKPQQDLVQSGLARMCNCASCCTFLHIHKRILLRSVSISCLQRSGNRSKNRQVEFFCQAGQALDVVQAQSGL